MLSCITSSPPAWLLQMLQGRYVYEASHLHCIASFCTGRRGASRRLQTALLKGQPGQSLAIYRQMVMNGFQVLHAWPHAA